MNKKGFTLIELLAVIVILAVILVIAVPRIIDTIEQARVGSLNDTTVMLVSSAEREYVQRSALETLDQDTDPILCSDIATLDSGVYANCNIAFDGSGNSTVTFEAYNNGTTYYGCSGTKTTVSCAKYDVGGFIE